MIGRNRCERAVARTAVGMARKRGAPPRPVGDAARIGGLAPQPGQDLLAHAADRVGVEARLVEREPQQVEARLQAVLQQADRSVEIVLRDREAQLDGIVLELAAGTPWRRARPRRRRAATRPCSRRPACRSGLRWRRRRKRNSARPAAAMAHAPARLRCRRAKPRAAPWSRPRAAPPARRSAPPRRQ